MASKQVRKYGWRKGPTMHWSDCMNGEFRSDLFRKTDFGKSMDADIAKFDLAAAEADRRARRHAFWAAAKLRLLYAFHMLVPLALIAAVGGTAWLVPWMVKHLLEWVVKHF